MADFFNILDSTAGASGGSTEFVAASTADNRIKTAADFICDSTADDVEIQAAIDALPS